VIVKNVSRGPHPVDGCGVLAPGETGPAEDTEHTRALVDAGHLIELPADTAVLEEMTVPELKQAAAAADLPVPSRPKKQDLVDALTDDKEK
jgi:hypothetical protein